MWTVFTSLYPTHRLYVVGGVLVLAFIVAHWIPLVSWIAWVGMIGAAAAIGADVALHVLNPNGMTLDRTVADRFSNGDRNPVTLHLGNRYVFPVRVTCIDEPPVKFQIRDAVFEESMPSASTRTITYHLRPTERGRYAFGRVNAYVHTPIGLIARRYQSAEGPTVKVYPSFIQMRRIGLLATTNRLEEAGVKRVRRRGHSTSFDHVRPYVLGDDYRHVNWTATARRADLMVNEYEEERGQPLYCAINTGRVMELPFNEMTLLDHSINATLALANVAMQKQDRVSVVPFDKRPAAAVPLGRGPGHLMRIQEALYHLETGFPEADYRRLAVFTERHLTRRGVLLLFTNVESRASLERHLPVFQSIQRRHTLLVVLFENPVLRETARAETAAATAWRTSTQVEDAYVRTVAERFAYEKHEMVRTLRRHGIKSVLTPPEHLTVEALNAYLAVKRG